MLDDEELNHLQELLSIHNGNIRKIKKDIAQHSTPVPLGLQNRLEYEEKQKYLTEIKILAHRTLRQLEANQGDIEGDPYLL
jgi:hypothetical protein